MDEKFIALHRAYVEGYLDRFNTTSKLRNSISEKIEYAVFQIQIEKQREARYKSELQPDKYTDHKLYVDEIVDIVHSLELYLIELKQSASQSIKAYSWLIDEDKKRLLYDKLCEAGFIDEKTVLSAFTKLFSSSIYGNADEKIIWLKKGKNKDINKKSVFNLLDVLQEYKVISDERKMTKTDVLLLLNTLFQSINRESLKFSLPNYSMDTKSQYDTTLREIVVSIL